MDYQVLKKNFENHRFQTSYFETKEEAAAYLKEKMIRMVIWSYIV